jgi:hypothetical protein
MVERIGAWRCIGCGKVDAPQTCIGICQDRRVELVDAADYDQLAAEREQLRAQCATMTALLHRIVRTTPREHDAMRTWHAFQRDARRSLAALATAGPSGGAAPTTVASSALAATATSVPPRTTIVAR